MKKIFLILLIGICAFASELKLKSNLNAIKLIDEKLLIGLDNGEILSVLVKDKQEKLIAKLAKIKNFYEDNVDPRIYSIDYFDGMVLVLSEGDFGSKKLNIYNENMIFDFQLPNNSVKKALFLNNNIVVLAALDSSVELLDLKTKKVIKNTTFSNSSLSDVVLDEHKNILVAGFESGEIVLFDLNKWQKIKNYKNIHKDNIYQLDYKNKTILSCSTDRKLGIIANNNEKILEKDFLIYACALNQNGTIAAFSDNEKNIIELVDTKTLKTIKKFQNRNFLLEYLIFLNDDELVSAGFENTIIFWSINESF
ncbi:WD40 repeat domain-containing protein [Campylobacter insulaenigrae]|uniref:WD40 repeat domain-containing protein n=1 Tax=Campylobacter insulaenigrae TaxID=260714 RepID=A0ABY3G3B1_9BACT|nr:WD40 repeat domain-containing protein [Campylobacter insulaenigrae]MCR6570276.1 WD40 repeat domain-containing protein [Campylobacter insulaenigrae]MCR6571678.1 WD40 repeat domain-containing protein [Campylobacter insulaenigrae]MCR6573316.1 WD40 repeat domain-containing protein [Campylobacter insulaenigrae]MCR6574781.1 WD40 repeat domain-containing protein [Campylobacter insulaenigrae]MCR6576527.1 WD40 repeat domain-containing protein [Campylobacter insulaenigrae]